MALNTCHFCGGPLGTTPPAVNCMRRYGDLPAATGDMPGAYGLPAVTFPQVYVSTGAYLDTFVLEDGAKPRTEVRFHVRKRSCLEAGINLLLTLQMMPQMRVFTKAPTRHLRLLDSMPIEALFYRWRSHVVQRWLTADFGAIASEAEFMVPPDIKMLAPHQLNRPIRRPSSGHPKMLPRVAPVGLRAAELWRHGPDAAYYANQGGFFLSDDDFAKLAQQETKPYPLLAPQADLPTLQAEYECEHQIWRRQTDRDLVAI